MHGVNSKKIVVAIETLPNNISCIALSIFDSSADLLIDSTIEFEILTSVRVSCEVNIAFFVFLKFIFKASTKILLQMLSFGSISLVIIAHVRILH